MAIRSEGRREGVRADGDQCIVDPTLRGRTLDLVNGESLTYESLLRQTAQALGKKRLMVSVPIASTGFSKRWVQLFSGASHELIAPLIDSLPCDLPQLDPVPEIARLIRHHLARLARSDASA